MNHRALIVSFTLSLVACGGDTNPLDAGGGGMDAGATRDAGSGGTDAGSTPVDGAVDAGGDIDDAGEVDAGGADASASDAGTTDPDAGTTDPDAGGGACDAMDAMEGTPCGPTERPGTRYVWNGFTCEFQAWCRCLGADCEERYATEADCLAVYGACVTPCTSDAECASGAEWCEDGSCVACDNSGTLCLIRCSTGWSTYQRNGCSPCECAPPNECTSDGDCARGETCYAGEFCWCPGGGQSPDCCRGNVCEASGCTTSPTTGCATRGCPRGDVCSIPGDTCTPSSCNCGPTGSWSCTRDCGGGSCSPP